MEAATQYPACPISTHPHPQSHPIASAAAHRIPAVAAALQELHTAFPRTPPAVLAVSAATPPAFQVAYRAHRGADQILAAVPYRAYLPAEDIAETQRQGGEDVRDVQAAFEATLTSEVRPPAGAAFGSLVEEVEEHRALGSGPFQPDRLGVRRGNPEVGLAGAWIGDGVEGEVTFVEVGRWGLAGGSWLGRRERRQER